MKIVVEPAKITNMILGEQKLDNNNKYRWIKYCITVEIDNGMLLYNTLTKETIFLESNEYNNVFDTSYISNNIQEELIKKWFLVDENFNEQTLFQNILSTLTSLKKRDYVNKYTIMTTTDCNARCFYCYELGRKRINMSSKTAVDVADYIQKSSRGQNIEISWFGGEPLYNYNVINIICDKLIENKIKFQSTMASNGFLFDRKIINYAKEKWNLKKVQITLDGTEKIYNSTKAYIYKNVNAFNKVIYNIEQLLNANIRVSVRLNVGKHNSKDLFSLIDILYNNFSKYDCFSVYTNALFEHTNESNDEKKLIIEKIIDINKKIYEKNLANLNLYTNQIRTNHCMADDDTYRVITPDGKLGKCEHHSEDEFIGNIYSAVEDLKVIDSWKIQQDYIPKCDTCELFPQCIRLKKCPDIAQKCDEYDIKLRIENIKNIIKKLYENSL